MKTAMQPDPVLRQSTAKRAIWFISLRGFLLATVCALLPTISLQAQSRLLTLAMVRPDDLPVRRVVTASDRFVIETSTPAPASTQTVSTRSDGPSLLASEKFVLSLRTLQEWRREPQTGNAFSLSRMSLRDFGRPNAWACLQAGYGQLFNDKTPLIYGRNGSWFEEPSCGYFRICFSF